MGRSDELPTRLLERRNIMPRLCSPSLWVAVFLSAACSMTFAFSPCKIHSATFDGWQAQEVENQWVKLTFVPQIGGRLMQVQFGDHEYLFVNSAYKGKYFGPEDATARAHWINYGGDKLWPLPEGKDDGQHWPGPISDLLDDGEYRFSVVEQGQTCGVRLEGPADPKTGLQYSRDISLSSDSPEIHFHAVMKNASQGPIRWSVQSVTQYDTTDHHDPARYNADFWAITPVNPKSGYLEGYWVRSGLADDPSFEVKDGLFHLHWLYLENEVWLDSNAGWVAVVDDADRFAMIERFRYAQDAEYPGKASVIFYKNGAALELNSDGMPVMRDASPEQAPYYMEAELNSPMVLLAPGATFAMDTEWFPVRSGKQLARVTDAGVIRHPLVASVTANGVHLSGSFGVFFPGKLVARVFDSRGTRIFEKQLLLVDPLQGVEVDQIIPLTGPVDTVRVDLVGNDGADRGELDEARITRPEKIS
jgi:hypothetical protein